MVLMLSSKHWWLSQKWKHCFQIGIVEILMDEQVQIVKKIPKHWNAFCALKFWKRQDRHMSAQKHTSNNRSLCHSQSIVVALVAWWVVHHPNSNSGKHFIEEWKMQNTLWQTVPPPKLLTQFVAHYSNGHHIGGTFWHFISLVHNLFGFCTTTTEWRSLWGHTILTWQSVLNCETTENKRQMATCFCCQSNSHGFKGPETKMNLSHIENASTRSAEFHAIDYATVTSRDVRISMYVNN